jgi:hypothetical protein
VSLPGRKHSTGIRAARNEFLVRFYRWALADTLAQFNEGFPRLRNLKSGPALRYLEFLDNLAASDQRRFVVAKLKQSHRPACVLLDQPLSPAERALLGEFYRGHEVAMPATSIRAYVSSHVEMALNDLRVSAPASFAINKTALRSEVKARLQSVLGGARQGLGGPQALEFNGRIGDWSLITIVDTPRTFQLRYNHSIRSTSKTYIIERTSAFGWMGVGMVTYWDYMTASDVDATADWLTKMCRLFLDALPKLLKGLNPSK